MKILSAVIGAALLLHGALPASTPAELSRAATIAGRGLYSSTTTSTETSFDDQWTRMVRISRYAGRIFSDPSAEGIWLQAQRHASRALAALVRIAQIDEKKPSNWDVVVSGLKAGAEDTKDKDRTEWGKDIWIRLLMEANKANLQEEFRDAEWDLNSKLAELAGTVNTSAASQGVSVAHLPSWQGAYDSDLLVLTNNTGRNLAWPAIFVTLHGGDGARVTHLHRASNWLANQKLYVHYPYYRTDYALGRTLNRPARIAVSVFTAEEFFQDAYAWTSAGWDSTVRRYIEDLRLSGHYLGEYVESGSDKVYYPGYKFSVSGLNRLPIKRITIRFTRRGTTQEVYWDWNKYLPSGQEVVLRSEYFAEYGGLDPPDRKEIVLEFTDASVPARFVQ